MRYSRCQCYGHFASYFKVPEDSYLSADCCTCLRDLSFLPWYQTLGVELYLLEEPLWVIVCTITMHAVNSCRVMDVSYQLAVNVASYT